MKVKLTEVYNSILHEAKCPSCGSVGAYVGLNNVECPNSSCKNYKKSVSDDLELAIEDAHDDYSLLQDEIWSVTGYSNWNDPKSEKREEFCNKLRYYVDDANEIMEKILQSYRENPDHHNPNFDENRMRDVIKRSAESGNKLMNMLKSRPAAADPSNHRLINDLKYNIEKSLPIIEDWAKFEGISISKA